MVNNKKLLTLDPRTKLLLISVLGLCTFAFASSYSLMTLLFIISLLMFCSGVVKTTLRFLLIFLFTFGLEYILIAIGASGLGVLVNTVVYIFQRFAFLFMLCAFLSETTALSELIAALEKIRLPKEVLLPFSVALRFIPTIQDEYGYLRDSMKIRNIDFSLKGFLKSPPAAIEHMVVPLLIRSYRISDELAASAMVRGLDSECPKTALKELKFSALDMLIILIMIPGTIGLFIIDYIYWR